MRVCLKLLFFPFWLIIYYKRRPFCDLSVITFSKIIPGGYLSTISISKDLFPVLTTSGDSVHLSRTIYHSTNFPLAKYATVGSLSLQSSTLWSNGEKKLEDDRNVAINKVRRSCIARKKFNIHNRHWYRKFSFDQASRAYRKLVVYIVQDYQPRTRLFTEIVFDEFTWKLVLVRLHEIRGIVLNVAD